MKAALRLCALLLILVNGVAAAQDIETPARQALLIDAETGNVLLEKAADEAMPPSSMSKMMTVYIVFDQIKRGKLKLDDKMKVSAEAWRRWAGSEGSLMFLGVGEEVTVRDLLHGIIVSSGNDACTVVAENLAGTEEGFAIWMNDMAHELGMTGSHFTNASGWPDPEQYVTAQDLALLARRTILDFPDLYTFYAEKTFTYGAELGTNKPIAQPNRNPLLFTTRGADGLKTGHTEAAGYGMVGSALRDGRRMILVVNGLGSMRERAAESARLIEWGFRNFNNYRLFAAGDTVDQAEVWLGDAGKVPLSIDQDLVVTLSRRERANLAVKLVYDGPVQAPIAKGQVIAHLEINAPGNEPRIVALKAASAVGKLSGLGRLKAALEYFLWGASDQ